MEQPIAFYVEELYGRAYSLFLQVNQLRSTCSSSYLTEEQKLTLAETMLAQVIIESDGLTTRATEIDTAFFPPEPVE